MSQIGCFSRFIGFSFLVALLVVGGFLAYQAGIAQGISQAPEIGNAIQGAEPVSSVANPGFGLPPFLSLLGTVCLSVLGLFIFFGLVRSLSCLWRPRNDMGQAPDTNLNKAI
jgi:hypothetical protein